MKKFLSIILAVTLLLSTSVVFALPAYAATPYQPKGVYAYAISTGKITVKWKAAKGAKKYYVYRSRSKKKNYKRIAIVKNPKYTSSKLKKSTKYYFKIKAVNGKRKSKYSAVVSARTHKTYNKEKLKKAFGDKVQYFIDKYGAPETKVFCDNEWGKYYYVDGLSIVKQKDFNNDGVPELVVCYSKDLEFVNDNGEYSYFNTDSKDRGFLCGIYKYSDGAVKRVHICSLKMEGTSGVDIPEYISFVRYNHKDYLVYQPEGDGWRPTSHKALVDGKMKTIYKYEAKYNPENDTFSYYRNGKTITESEHTKNTDVCGNSRFDTTFVSGLSYSEATDLVAETNAQIEKY